MNTLTTVEELLDASFSMRFVSYQRKVDDYFLLERLVYILNFRYTS
jgi:hypothetical protein